MRFIIMHKTTARWEAGAIPDPKLIAEIQTAIDAANQQLARVEQIKKFAILDKPFGIDTGELTPTMKIKRKVVAQKYAQEIEAMYVTDGSDAN